MIDPDDERTALSLRRGQASTPEREDPLDDRTLPSRRASAEADAADDTVISAGSAVPSDSGLATQAATESAPAGPRRTAHPPAREPRDAPAASRRTPSPAPLTPEPAARTSAALGRVASSPTSAVAAYRARDVPPVTAVRAEPARRAPQDHVDTAAADQARRRRRRRQTIAVVSAASVLVIVAVVALVALLTTG
ncbi:hypothetical protein MRBLWH7_002105 [Microbacterium sp. LWH7-1.2]|uniref:hypothetical protein n=1 Tax=Microbacterium sp. LWH7-1.2 TaxID=3135257 RepID=UPI0031388F8D